MIFDILEESLKETKARVSNTMDRELRNEDDITTEEESETESEADWEPPPVPPPNKNKDDNDDEEEDEDRRGPEPAEVAAMEDMMVKYSEQIHTHFYLTNFVSKQLVESFNHFIDEDLDEIFKKIGNFEVHQMIDKRTGKMVGYYN